MTTAVLGSSSGIAGGPSGLSGGPSGADCGCGCGPPTPEAPCDFCKQQQQCATVTASPGPACDANNFSYPERCFVDTVLVNTSWGTDVTTGQCFWVWTQTCPEPTPGFLTLGIGFDPVTLLWTIAVGNNIGGGVYQGESLPYSTLSCIGGVLSGSVTIPGIDESGEGLCSSYSAVVTLGTGSDCIKTCWRQVFSCLGPPPTNVFVTCDDATGIDGNVISISGMAGGCFFLSSYVVSSLPGGATVVPRSSITVGSGNCISAGCVAPPCYVQARLCACNSVPITGSGDQGELVDAWFACDDTPAGGAFFVEGIGCCYVQTQTIFGINQGYPDGNSTLGGTLYASTDVTPYSNCAVCMETLGCIFGTGDYESWDDFISGGVPMYGFNQSYPVNGNYLVQFLTGPGCAGDVILSCSGAISGDITADPSTPCQWAGTFTIGACSVTIQVFYSSGWKARFNGGANGTYTVNINAPSCTPVGPYADGGGCIDFESILTAITDFVVG